MNVLGRDYASVHHERKMRAAQQLEQRPPREVGRDGAEHEVDRRRERLGPERERIERLVRNLCVREDLACQIQIRQRTLKHDRRPPQRGRAITRGLQRPREFRQLLFPVAADERARRRPRCLMCGLSRGLAEAVARRREVRHHEHRRRGDGLFEPHVLDPRQLAVVQPVVIPGVEQRLGGHHVDRLQEGHPRQQIEVGRPQPQAIRRLVRDGDDDAPIERTRRPQRQRPDGMFVDAGHRGERAFERLERRREESRLREEASRAAIELGAPLELLRHQALEVRHRLMPSSQLVVQRKDLRDETRAQVERGFRPRRVGRVGGPPQQDLAVE